MTQVEISKIKVEDRIRKTFNNIEELAVEIDELGLINPITITKDFKLLAGERRLRAHKHLGRTHIEANIVDTDDEETQLLIEIKENETRESFTFSERMDYARRLERIEREKAEKRMLAGKADPRQNSAQGKTSEIVADELDAKRGTYHEIGLRALYEIATMPEEARTEAHTIPSTGATKTVDEMTVRELREVKAELKKAQEMAQQAERK